MASELDKIALQEAHGPVGAAACAWWDTLTGDEQAATDPTDVSAWCEAIASTAGPHTLAISTIQALVCANDAHRRLVHPVRLTVWTAAMFGVTITDDDTTHRNVTRTM